MLQDKELLFNYSHKAGWTIENSVSTVQCARTQGIQSLTFIWQRNQNQISEQSSPPTGFQADMGISRMEVKSHLGHCIPSELANNGRLTGQGQDKHTLNTLSLTL